MRVASESIVYRTLLTPPQQELCRTLLGVWSTAVRILLRCHSVIPSLGYPHSVTDEPMMVLDPMDLEARDIVHCTVHEHHWRKQRQHHCHRWGSCQALLALTQHSCHQGQ